MMTIEGVDEALLAEATAIMTRQRNPSRDRTSEERAAAEEPAGIVNDALSFVIARWY